MYDPLPSDLAAALSAARPGFGRFADVRYVASADSTNDLALGLAAGGAPEGVIVLADHQRAGRGRRGREWFSPPGAGLYLSAIVRPEGPASGVPLVTLAAGVAAARAIQSTTGLPVELKWPNDLVVGRPWRKLAGVLCETVGGGARIDAVVVGLGVNVLAAAYPREISDSATSVEAELGRPVERAPLVVAVVAALADVMERLRRGDRHLICQEWRTFAAAGLGGAPVHWTDRGVARAGRARDIDDAGALVVESDGRLQRLVAGEVQWRGLSRD
jgi:BirA family biotin operon repressor/biotin-[acetyl-CoA-carboxylase] ligase